MSGHTELCMQIRERTRHVPCTLFGRSWHLGRSPAPLEIIKSTCEEALLSKQVNFTLVVESSTAPEEDVPRHSSQRGFCVLFTAADRKELLLDPGALLLDAGYRLGQPIERPSTKGIKILLISFHKFYQHRTCCAWKTPRLWETVRTEELCYGIIRSELK